MSDSFAIAENAEVTRVRQGNPVGGRYVIPNNIGTNWNRLMPSGNNGAVVASSVEKFNEKLNIGNLRSDIEHAPIGGWLLRILNDGYKNVYRIIGYDPTTNIVHLAHADRYSGLDLQLQHIQPDNAIQFVIYPTVIDVFKVGYRRLSGGNNANDTMEIGNLTDDRWQGNVNPLDLLYRNEVFHIPTQRIDRLMYRMSGYANNASYSFSWGEHFITTKD